MLDREGSEHRVGNEVAAYVMSGDELEQLRGEHQLTVRRFCQLVGLAVRTYYDRRARHLAGRRTPRGPWPTPARDRVGERVIEMALTYPMWGHRKIAWLCRHDGLEVSDATCLRVLRDAGLVLPVDYVRERRDLAKAGSVRGSV